MKKSGFLFACHENVSPWVIHLNFGVSISIFVKETFILGDN